MMRWFGAPYDAPAWDDMSEVETPVGKPCMHCTELIEEGDPGVVMPYVGMNEDGSTFSDIRPVHLECHLRSFLGSVEHLDGKCFCETGKHAESGLTYREEARLVMERLRKERGL